MKVAREFFERSILFLIKNGEARGLGGFGPAPKGLSLNLLARANREIGADFRLDQFRHEADYDPRTGRVAIHLRSLADQTVRVGAHAFHLVAGEAIHIEDSWKYSLDGFRALARRAGFEPVDYWIDAADLFSVHLLEAAS